MFADKFSKRWFDTRTNWRNFAMARTATYSSTYVCTYPDVRPCRVVGGSHCIYEAGPWLAVRVVKTILCTSQFFFTCASSGDADWPRRFKSCRRLLLSVLYRWNLTNLWLVLSPLKAIICHWKRSVVLCDNCQTLQSVWTKKKKWVKLTEFLVFHCKRAVRTLTSLNFIHRFYSRHLLSQHV
jgi:hypothetical protein